MHTRKRESVSVAVSHSYTEGLCLDSHPGLIFAESCLLGGAGSCKVNTFLDFTDQSCCFRRGAEGPFIQRG